MEYKKTAEYAYDLIMHFYKLHEEQINILGRDNIKILIPEEIMELLKVVYPFTNKFDYPVSFMKIELKAYSGNEILFVLKENKK